MFNKCAAESIGGEGVSDLLSDFVCNRFTLVG